MRSIAYKWDSDTKGHVDVSEEEDVRSLRCLLSKELGLPASQGLRLKCGSRDLRDGDRISAIGGTVHAMPHGGLAGGAGSKRPAKNAPLEQKKRAKATSSSGEGEGEGEAANEDTNLDTITERGFNASVKVHTFYEQQLSELDGASSVQVTRVELVGLKKAVLAMHRSIVHLVEERHALENRHTIELRLVRQAAGGDAGQRKAQHKSAEAKNAANIMEIVKLRDTLAEANQKLAEAGMEEVELEADADDEVHQRRELLPFEQKLINLMDEPGSRAIHWIYSITGTWASLALPASWSPCSMRSSSTRMHPRPRLS